MNKSSQQLRTVKFSTNCTMDTASADYEKVMDAIHHFHNVKLDLTDITKVDASFIQLLVTAQLEAKRYEAKLEIIGNSDIVNELATHIFCHVSLISTDNANISGV